MARSKTLRFHAATFELVGKKPRPPRRALELLKQRERRAGVRFPASVSLSKIRWQRCAESFSTFMYCRAWDHGHCLERPSLWLAAEDQPLGRRDLAFLRANFSQGPTTFGHPGEANYRFFTPDAAILIWASKDQAEWRLDASSDEALLQLLRRIAHSGSLKRTLHTFDPRSAAVLERAKTEWTRSRKQVPASRKRARRKDQR